MGKNKMKCPECMSENTRIADQKRHPEVYICERACCFFSLCECIKDMLPLFVKGSKYSYRKPTKKEINEFGCSYVFFSESGAKVMIQYDELIEHF